MNRLVPIAATAVMSLGGLTGCGGGSSDYCSAVEDGVSADELSDADGIKAFEDLRDKAPDEIKDDFDSILSFISSPGDAAELDLEEMTAALDRITTYTEAECDVDLDLP